MLLRRPTSADTEVFVEVHTSPETHVFPGVSPRTRAESLQLLERYQHDWDTDGVGYWSVLRATSGGVLGFGGLRHTLDDGEMVLNLYFRFPPTAWGHGYASEMGHAAVRGAPQPPGAPDRPRHGHAQRAHDPGRREARLPPRPRAAPRGRSRGAVPVIAAGPLS
ncbi:N-acetyltransferase [Saccharopolyspora rhizosphaerae]|uniref:N-acetyltransferase n=1 Tax=Saccharopolyspora rhizosphaerae TaxID=2492662 RepID=A0A3R8QXI9_9PSEU|nr:N-acetyltransferase [Saccharopolyspora rhizosphaerae]